MSTLLVVADVVMSWNPKGSRQGCKGLTCDHVTLGYVALAGLPPGISALASLTIATFTVDQTFLVLAAFAGGPRQPMRCR
jgi:hypothetical protein